MELILVVRTFNPLRSAHQNHTTTDHYTLCCNTVIGTLSVDGWVVTLGTARRGLGGLRPCLVPSSLYQLPNVTVHPSTATIMHHTNFLLFDVAL